MGTPKSLSERQQAILSAIVQNYVLTAQPVGSRTLSRSSSLRLSPASIRNVMSDLEELGYLEQPHASAGRIPTDLGYRYYVDNIMRQVELSTEEQNAISSSLENVAEMDGILDVTSRALGKVTQQLGVALSPRFEEGVFRRIDFVSLSSEKVLLALQLRSGIVKTMVVEIDSQLGAEKLNSVCTVFNERFMGKKVRDIQDTIDSALSGVQVDSKQFGAIRLFIPSFFSLLQSASQAHLHTAGMPVVLTQPEFANKPMLDAIVELLEDQSTLVHLMSNQSTDRKIHITIGGENEKGRFKSFSVVTSSYRVGSMHGTLGVLGPKRMAYPKLVSAVDYTVKALEKKQMTL